LLQITRPDEHLHIEMKPRLLLQILLSTLIGVAACGTSVLVGSALFPAGGTIVNEPARRGFHLTVEATAWSLVAEPRDHASSPRSLGDHMWAGWPLRAATRPTRFADFAKIFPSSPPPGVDANSATILEFRPLWAGFALNTLLYATAAWLLLFAPGAARRRIRRRRRQCESCGYLRGETSVCTECGQSFPVAT
jgi:hypothetical protein